MADYPGAIFTQADVPPGTNLGGATPTHRVRENNMKDEIVAAETELGINPHLLDATVTVTTTPATVKQKTDVLSRRIADIIGTFSGSVAISLGGLAALFDATTGHTHSGSGTNGPKADAGKLQGRNVSAAAPSVGDVPTWSGSAWAPAAGGGGGGGGAGTINIEELDGTPTGAFDTLKVPNGSLTDNMDGSASLAFSGGGGGSGYGIAFTPPVPSDFAWINQSGSTDDGTSPFLAISKVLAASGSISGKFKAAPGAAPWHRDLVFDFQGPVPSGTSAGAGIALRDSASGKLILFQHFFELDYFDAVTMNSATSFSGASALPYYSKQWQRPFCVRVEDDGTNINFYVSMDRMHFMLIYTVTRAAFLTAGADQYGPYVYDNSLAVGNTTITLMSDS